MRLSFRVRNGSGRAPHAIAADRWAAPTVLGVPEVLCACPGGRMAKERRSFSGLLADPCGAEALAGPRREMRGKELGRLVRLG